MPDIAYQQQALSEAQVELIERPIDSRIFLEGLAGCGKTTAGVERLLAMMASGIPGNKILLWVPQRTLAEPYRRALEHPGVIAGGEVSILTLAGLAQRMVDFFWPVIAEKAGFTHSGERPVFLNLETAQYYMAHLVRPLLDEGLFNSISIDRNRLYSQILDNLNKAAVVGFPITEIGERLKEAWVGEPGQLSVYDDVQLCVSKFRAYCLEHNLLDFSLLVETFIKYLWQEKICKTYLSRTYDHLIVDNLEEDTPVAHDLISQWMDEFESVLLIYDHEAGYRRFLGADPLSAYRLSDQCDEKVVFDHSWVNHQAIFALIQNFQEVVKAQSSGIGEESTTETDSPPAFESLPQVNPDLSLSALEFEYFRFFPEMLDWVSGRIKELLSEGIYPHEIAILSPFLSDALRFSLTNRLNNLGVPVRSHRPSRSLREEPIVQCLLTLSSLAFPGWRIVPTSYDIANALVQAISGLDLVRAQLIVNNAYKTKDDHSVLNPFETIPQKIQERITYSTGERYDRLLSWLESNKDSPYEFDHFLSHLFGELLSQPGFGFHNEFVTGEVTANLIDSVRNFRWTAGSSLEEEGNPLGKEYLTMMQEGVLASQFLRSWQTPVEEAVFLAPAYTFLMSNRPVSVQVWLDVGGLGWFERLNQPLTQPYVLNRQWQRGMPWTDLDEVETSQNSMRLLLLGLMRRCQDKIILGVSQLGEQGYEQRGPLLRLFQNLLRNISNERK